MEGGGGVAGLLGAAEDGAGGVVEFEAALVAEHEIGARATSDRLYTLEEFDSAEV